MFHRVSVLLRQDCGGLFVGHLSECLMFYGKHQFICFDSIHGAVCFCVLAGFPMRARASVSVCFSPPVWAFPSIGKLASV